MSEIQRYHTNEYGDLVKSNASYAKLCKYEDVKDLERQLDKREDDYRQLMNRSDKQIEGLQSQLAEARERLTIAINCMPKLAKINYEQDCKELGLKEQGNE